MNTQSATQSASGRPTRAPRRHLPARLLRAAAACLILVATWSLRAQTASPAESVSLTAASDATAEAGSVARLRGFAVSAASPVRVTVNADGGLVAPACGTRCVGVAYESGDGQAGTELVVSGEPAAVSAAIGALDVTAAGDGDVAITVRAIERDMARFGRHYYRYVPGARTWADAVAAAGSESFHGLTGYLATVASAAEDDFLRSLRVNSNIFLGGSDADVEGEWRWATGPDAGSLFWVPSCGTGSSGECADTGAYANWRPGEPSDDGGAGDVLTQRMSGWNDVAPGNACCSYIVEFGGIGSLDLPTVSARVTFTPTTTTTSSPSSTAPPPSTTGGDPTTSTATSTTVATTDPTTSAPATTGPDPTSGGTDVPTSPPPGTDPPPSRTVPRTTADEPPTPAQPRPGVPGASSPITVGAAGESADGDDPPPVVADAAAGSGAAPAAGAATASKPGGSAGGGAGTPGGGGGPAGPGGAGPGVPGGAGSAKVEITIDGRIGDPVAGRPVTFEGVGLPGSIVVRAVVRSDPIEIARATTTADGRFAITGKLPDGLEPGDHSLQIVDLDDVVYATGRFDIRADGTLGASQRSLGVLPASDPAPYDPADDAAAVLGLGVAGVVLLSAAASSSSGSKPSSGRDDVQMGSVSELDAKFHRVETEGLGRGDRSRTWDRPGTDLVDRWSVAIPQRLDRAFPLLARVIGDANYLRAMTGSFALLLPLSGVVLGVAGAADAGFEALPPATPLVVAVVVLSCIDALAGFTAALAYCVATVLGGGVGGDRTLLGMFGVAVVMIGAPLVASTMRPLARRPNPSWPGRWDRCADAVVAGFVTGWAVRSMVRAIPGLRGLQVPLTGDADIIAWAAVAAIAVRVAAESLAANAYPSRLHTLAIDTLEAPSTRRKLLTIAERVVLFLLASYRFVGGSWHLWAGAALYAVPQLLPLVDSRFPESERLFRILPRGLLKSVFMLLVGTLWGRAVATQFDGGDLLRAAFVALPLPGLIMSILALIGRDGPRPTLGWWHRLGGAVIFVAGVLLALGRLI